MLTYVHWMCSELVAEREQRKNEASGITVIYTVVVADCLFAEIRFLRQDLADALARFAMHDSDTAQQLEALAVCNKTHSLPSSFSCYVCVCDVQTERSELRSQLTSLRQDLTAQRVQSAAELFAERSRAQQYLVAHRVKRGMMSIVCASNCSMCR